MTFSAFIHLLDIIGSLVFALSGALAGSKKNMDALGMLVLAIATAVGGGTLRSLLIGDVPVPFLKDPIYLIICSIATLLVFVSKPLLAKLYKPILFLDAVGLGIFVSLGISAALAKNLPEWASLLMGVITGSFGGVIRDVLSAEIPLIFQKEIYATACLVGGLLFLLLTHFNCQKEVIILSSAILVFAVRLLALRLNWSLPKAS